jgi:glycosyltransferase involved in cell wall biosynthesis
MDRHRIAIIIPALNEAKMIERVVISALEYGIPIVVNDGSSDGTAGFAEAAGACVLSHDMNLGYDQALNSGFARASELGFKYVITMDADGQHDPGILSLFISELNAGADVVVGIRDKRQRLAEHVFAWVSYMKWGIRDPLCGMKAYRIDVYQELGHFDSYDSIGTELAIFAAKNGKIITQISVKTRERADAPRFGSRYLANTRIFEALWNSI